MSRAALIPVAASIAFGLSCAFGGVADAQDALQRGHAVFDHWCAGCHAPLTELHPALAGTSALQKKYEDAKPAALEQRTDLPAAQVKLLVRSGINAMPSFRKTEIGAADLDAVAAYISRNYKP